MERGSQRQESSDRGRRTLRRTGGFRRSIWRASWGSRRLACRFSRWMASYTSWRCTEISIGAAIPSRTLSPRISTTVMTMSSPMMILSSRCRDRTSIVLGSFLLPAKHATNPHNAAHAHGDHDGAGGGTSPIMITKLTYQRYAVELTCQGLGIGDGAGE